MRTVEAEERQPTERPGVRVRQVEGEGLEVHSPDPRLARRMVRCLEKDEPGLLVWAAHEEVTQHTASSRRKRSTRPGGERRVRQVGEREHAHMRERLREREEGGNDGQEEEGVWELCEEEEALERELLGEQGGSEEGGSEGTEGGGEAVGQGRQRVGGERRRGQKRPGEGDGWEVREEEASKVMKRGEGVDEDRRRETRGPEWGWPPFGDPG